MPEHVYDDVLGTGAAGLTAALRAAAGGAQVGFREGGAYVDTGPEVAAWLENNSPVEFETLRGMSDYHAEHRGGNRKAGRWSAPCSRSPNWADRVAVSAGAVSACRAVQ